MIEILFITDRAQEDESIADRVVELAVRLNADGIAAVVTRSADFAVPSGMLFGIPDGGLLPQEMSPCSLSTDVDENAATQRLFEHLRHQAMLHGLHCETIQAKTSLRRTAATLANAVGLVVFSRESLVCDDGEIVPLRTLWSEVAAPLLICPRGSFHSQNHQRAAVTSGGVLDATDHSQAPHAGCEIGSPWERIVVAAQQDASRDRLIAWGGHWARQFDVPLMVIDLHSPPRHSAWSAVSRWLPWSSPRHHREVVREGLLACGLRASDLLLVNREPAEWPFRANVCEATLDDLVAAAPCSLGVAPTMCLSASRALLFPHGTTAAEVSILGFVAA